MSDLLWEIVHISTLKKGDAFIFKPKTPICLFYRASLLYYFFTVGNTMYSIPNTYDRKVYKVLKILKP